MMLELLETKTDAFIAMINKDMEILDMLYFNVVLEPHLKIRGNRNEAVDKILKEVQKVARLKLKQMRDGQQMRYDLNLQ